VYTEKWGCPVIEGKAGAARWRGFGSRGGGVCFSGWAELVAAGLGSVSPFSFIFLLPFLLPF
jgi:hypothetical protein